MALWTTRARFAAALQGAASPRPTVSPALLISVSGPPAAATASSAGPVRCGAAGTKGCALSLSVITAAHRSRPAAGPMGAGAPRGDGHPEGRRGAADGHGFPLRESPGWIALATGCAGVDVTRRRRRRAEDGRVGVIGGAVRPGVPLPGGPVY